MVDEQQLLSRIEAMSARVDAIQACANGNVGRLDRAESNITSLIKQVGVMETILEGNVKVQEKLSTMLENFGTTLTDFKIMLAEIQINLKNMNDKMKEVESDTESLTERGQFDFIKWVKDNFITLLFGIGTIWAVVQSVLDAVNK